MIEGCTPAIAIGDTGCIDEPTARGAGVGASTGSTPICGGGCELRITGVYAAGGCELRITGVYAAGGCELRRISGGSWRVVPHITWGASIDDELGGGGGVDGWR